MEETLLKDVENLGTHPPKPYRPDGGFEVGGLGLLIAGISISAIVLGGIAHYVSQWFYLIILFPILIGTGLSMVGGKIVRSARLRNVPLVAACGLVAGILAMGTMHYLSFLSTQKAMAQAPADLLKFADESADLQKEALKDLPPGDRQKLEDFVELYQAQKNFFSYLDATAKEGVSINRATSSSGGLNLGYYGSYIYWLVETLIIGGIALFGLKSIAEEPYCTRCHIWKTPLNIFAWTKDEVGSKSAVESGSFSAIGKLVMESGESTPDSKRVSLLSLELNSCPKCQTMSTVDGFFKRTTVNAKGETKTKNISSHSYPGSCIADIKTLAALIDKDSETKRAFDAKTDVT